MSLKLNKSQWRQKAVLLSGLYTSQTLGLAFVTTSVPVILRQSGAGLDKISLIFVLGFCWSLKFLWAPFIDRYGSRKYGHYRSWIIALQILMIAVTSGASFLSVSQHLNLLCILFVFLSFFSATQDIASDGLSVNMLEPEERGAGSGIQSAGNMAGFMIGGGLVLMAYDWLGWKGCLLILAFGMALPLPVIISYREEPALEQQKKKTDYKALLNFFRKPGILKWLPILLIFRISGQITYWLLNPFLVDSGWSLDRIGISINVIGVIFGIAGSGSAAAMVRRLGRKTTMIAAILTGILGTAGLLGMVLEIYPPGSTAVYTVIGLIMTGYGFTSTIIYTVIMDKCDTSSAATDFTLQWSLTGVSAMAGGGVAMAMAEFTGYAGVLLISLGIAVVSIILVSLYKDFEPVGTYCQ